MKNKMSREEIEKKIKNLEWQMDHVVVGAPLRVTVAIRVELAALRSMLG